MKKTGIIISILILLAIIAGSFYYFFYYQVRKKVNTQKEIQVFIPTGSTLENVYELFSKQVDEPSSLRKTGEQLKLSKVYPGRYTFSAGVTNEDIINRLKEGKQDEIEIMVGNYYSIYELAQKLEPFFEINKDEIIQEILSRQETQGLNDLQSIYFLSPNTYKFHWNNTAKQIIDKIAQPYKKYWNEEKKSLLEKSGMTELQVMTLASIVQLESYRPEEQPKVAGVYLNRLKIGQKLQADPTVLFAKKYKEGWDKKIKRIYIKDLSIESPYNTYKYSGLPPGPICMPNPSAIDAVLQPEKHDYIYFVADTTQNGLHIFAKDYTEHERNAQIYRSWADRNNIK